MDSENRNRRSFLFPLIVILSGVIFQLQATGLLGESANSFLAKVWPVVILVAGLDLFFGSKRILASAVLCLLGAALLVYNLSGDTKLWELFHSFWPLLLILYGFAMLINGKSFSNILIIVVVIGVILYIFFVSNGSINLEGITSNIGGLSETFGSISQNASSSRGKSQEIRYPQTGLLPAAFQISAPSGKIQIKSAPLTDLVMTGKIELSAGEVLNESAEQNDSTATYILSGTPSAQVSGSNALWNLQISQQIQVNLMSAMNNGYQMIDLRGMNLSGSNIVSNSGDIDIMLPNSSSVTVYVSTQNGNIRIFVPAAVSAFITVQNTAGVSYPETYTQSGTQIFPVTASDGNNQVMVNVDAPTGFVKVISDQN